MAISCPRPAGMRPKERNDNSCALIPGFGKAVLNVLLLTGKYEKVDSMTAVFPGNAERAGQVQD